MQTPQIVITRAARQLMQRERYTQTDLARLLGLTQTNVSARLRGETRWSIDDLTKLVELQALPPITLWEEA